MVLRDRFTKMQHAGFTGVWRMARFGIRLDLANRSVQWVFMHVAWKRILRVMVESYAEQCKAIGIHRISKVW